MQLSLDPADFQAIADLVVRALTPRLAEIQEIARRAALPQPRPAESSSATASAKADILCRAEVTRMIGLSSSTLWRMEHDGRFPARIQLGPRRVGWRRAEVEAWLAERRSA